MGERGRGGRGKRLDFDCGEKGNFSFVLCIVLSFPFLSFSFGDLAEERRGRSKDEAVVRSLGCD